MCLMDSTNRYGHIWPWGFSFPEKAIIKQHQFSLWLPVSVFKLSVNHCFACSDVGPTLPENWDPAQSFSLNLLSLTLQAPW